MLRSLVVSLQVGQRGCKVERLVRGSGALFKISGAIDQTFDPMCFSQQSEGTTILDLDGVTSITSFGVREWNKAIQLVSSAYLGFVNVRPAMVTQFNVVAGVSGNGQIVSMYVPFICSCETAFENLYNLRGPDFGKLRRLEAEPPPCPACGKPSELDELASVYLGYINRQGPPAPPSDFDMVLEGTESSAPSNVVLERVQQEVEGNETYLWLHGPLDSGLGLRRVVDSLEGTVVVVLQTVTASGAEKRSHLAKLIHYAGGPLFFARVPPALRGVLRAEGANPRIGSWWISQPCPVCSEKIEFEVDGSHSPVEAMCLRCNEPRPLQPIDRALLVELTPLPPVVSASLAGRAGPRKAIGRGAFLSRFEVLRKLGSGGMGEVYLARFQGLGGFAKLVALKRILAGVRGPNATEMFLAEARVAARLSHRNIVQIFDVGHERGEFYMALEYVDGVDLRTLYHLCQRTHQFIDPAVGMQLIADAAAGLGAAHSHVDAEGMRHVIVHRDVSPHNILIGADGEVKIADFGIAKTESDPDDTPESVTKGKLSYLSPEQVRRERGGLEPRSDIFSLGVVLFQTLTLHHPFASVNPYDTLKAVLEREIPPVSDFREHVPLVDAIIARATAKELHARYPSAAAMRADLLAAIGTPPPDVSSWLAPLLKLRPANVAVGSNSWSPSGGSGSGDEATKDKPFKP